MLKDCFHHLPLFGLSLAVAVLAYGFLVASGASLA